MSKPREFWLAGEPNEFDVGIWYDHEPERHVVTGGQCWQHHVIEHAAYQALLAESMKLREALLKYSTPIAVKSVDDFDKFLKTLEG